MYKISMLLVVLSHYVLIAQDSLSIEFIKVYNQYRIQNNLPLLQYDMQLDSLAIIRLIESAKGIDDCFEDPNFRCKDSIRNLHFKYQTTVNDYHSKNPKTTVTGENMAVIGEFGYYSPRFTYMIRRSNLHVPLQNIAESFLKSWIDSPKHNELLLNTKANRCAFRVLRTMHQDKPWIHAIFLAGYNK